MKSEGSSSNKPVTEHHDFYTGQQESAMSCSDACGLSYLKHLELNSLDNIKNIDNFFPLPTWS
jgi:hypothetical protein